MLSLASASERQAPEGLLGHLGGFCFLRSVHMRASIYSVMALAVAAAPSAAQGRVEVTPFAGVYVPAAHVVDISAFCPGGPCGEVLKQEIAPLFGARVTAWVHERLALALRAEADDYVYKFSGTAVTSPPAYSLGVVAGNYSSGLQHDLVLSLGLSVAP